MKGMSINLESELLQLSHFRRATELDRTTGVERLGTGARVNRGADDPSGLAIGSGMRSQLGGIDTAIQNLSDGINLIHTADSVLSEVQDIFLRIRDLCVRGSNQATMVTTTGSLNSDPVSDTRQIFREVMLLQAEVFRKSTAVTFNGKKILHDFSAPDGKVLQIGPDNGSSHTITVEIPDLEGMGVPFYTPPPGNITSDQFTTAFQQTLTLVDQRLETVSDTRADLGAQENRLLGHLENLTSQRINISAAKSDIIDANIAGEIIDMTRANVKSNFSTMAYSQSNVSKEIVFMMMESVGLK
ncbi:flagellin [bacterium]